MASKLTLVVIAVAAAILPNVAAATQYVVGDGKGWRVGVNYTAWAAGKEFFVGDSIVFAYSPGFHNVYKVSGPEFLACQVQDGETPLASGVDVVTFASPGRKWYFCGIADHCAAGQKLVISVQPSSASPSPAPSPH